MPVPSNTKPGDKLICVDPKGWDNLFKKGKEYTFSDWNNTGDDNYFRIEGVHGYYLTAEFDFAPTMFIEKTVKVLNNGLYGSLFIDRVDDPKKVSLSLDRDIFSITDLKDLRDTLNQLITGLENNNA